MSGGVACRTPVHRRAWRVLQRLSNHSAFSGGRVTPSAYSEVICGECGARWRTKATYVAETPDYQPGDQEPTDRLTAREAAALAGVAVSTFDAYVTRGYAPAPDGRLGNQRWWSRSTIERWKADRPGRGARTDLSGAAGERQDT